MLKVGERRAEVLILIKQRLFTALNKTGISWNYVLFPNATLAIWLLNLHFLFTVICFAWLNIQALGSFPNYSHHILLMNECEYWWVGTCAYVYMPVCFLRIQREEGSSKHIQKAQCGLFMLCHTSAVIPRQSICYIIGDIC